MNIVIFGASGMVGQGVLHECMGDAAIDTIFIIGRTTGQHRHDKVIELQLPPTLDYSSLKPSLTHLDACFFCLGVSAAGLGEAAYRQVTYDITLTAAAVLAPLNPQMTFIYISGAGTDSTAAGPIMWARVKGQTENALLAMPFKAAYMLRPGIIQPLRGIKSKTRSYRVLYAALSPLLPALLKLWPDQVTTTERLGQVMIRLAKQGFNKKILDSRDINRLSH